MVVLKMYVILMANEKCKCIHHFAALRPTPLYKFVVIICSSCKFVQVPQCTGMLSSNISRHNKCTMSYPYFTEFEEPCLQTDNCKCPLPTNCPYCAATLESDSVMVRFCDLKTPSTCLQCYRDGCPVKMR